jgi:hypothetical protein
MYVYWGELKTSTSELDALIREIEEVQRRLSDNQRQRIIDLLDTAQVVRQGLGGPEWPIYMWAMELPDNAVQEIRDLIALVESKADEP